MTPTDTPPDRRPLAALTLVAALLGVAAALAVTTGCGKPPPPMKYDEETTVAKGDPWKGAAQRLRKDTDLAACRAALGGLANDLNTQNKEALPVLSAADLAKLGELVPLNTADLDEVRSAAFVAHDSAYLADCLYLRDAAQSLAPQGLTPDQKAEAAFAWVCRHVYLQPWVRQTGPPPFGPTILPPTAVLRRGFGSGLERMYVFLALLQQLELDGCLIGAPDAGTQPAGLPILTTDKKGYVTGPPRGPFWAVGARIGTDVKLFDPWRGQSLPVTLAQLKANPDAAKAWFADPANTSGATLDDAKKATAFLAVPVNALSARMAAVDSKLKGDLGAKLSYDAKALRDSFPDPKPAFWNPPDEPFAYGRAARTLLPADIGGTDRGAPGSRLYDSYMREQLPASVFSVPPGLLPGGPIDQRLRAVAAGALVVSFIEPPNPRERIQRGQFQDAAKDMVAKQEAFTTGLERLRLNKDADQQVAEWTEAANGLYQALTHAQFISKDANAEATAVKQIDSHWRLPGAQFLVDRSSSEVGLAEATFLLALNKHELAERSRSRVDRATGAEADRLRPDAQDSWKTALSAWRTYDLLSTAHAGFPGRAAHARALAARAENLVNPNK